MNEIEKEKESKIDDYYVPKDMTIAKTIYRDTL